jgi:hypothetical protein
VPRRNDVARVRKFFILTAIAFAQNLRSDKRVEDNYMTKMNSAFLFIMLMLTAAATPAMAKKQKSFDVCINPATDLATQDDATKPGAFATVAANIYPGGTIPTSGATSCASITIAVIGTFYANAGLELGLPAAKDVQAFVTWHFDFTPNGTFVTVGPVPFAPNAGGPTTYPQTLAGASGPFPSSGVATITPLSSDGFQFNITLPHSGHDH